MQLNTKEVDNNISILTVAFIFVFFMRNLIPPAFVILVGIFYGLIVVVSLDAL